MMKNILSNIRQKFLYKFKIKMKKVTLLILTLITSLGTIAQCWTNPVCTQTVNVYGGLGNASYNGSVCFKDVKSNGNGKENISNSVSWNTWNYLLFDGNFKVEQTINFSNTSNKVYALGGDIIFDRVSMDGNDTIYVTGQLEIKNLVSNNSNNIIILGTNASVIINGVRYIQRNNISNVTIIPCSDPTLPVKFTDFKVKYIGEGKTQVTFSYNEALNIQKFEIMVSSDEGKTFKPLLIILPDDAKTGTYSVTIKLR